MAGLPHDEILTREGAAVEAGAPSSRQGARSGAHSGAPPVVVIACGALAREILAVLKSGGWGHVALRCLPADLHLRPEKIPDAVEAAVGEARADGAGSVFVAYADCGTGGLLQARCAALGVEMIAGPHCYSFFDGNDAFAARGDAEMRCFFLTDFLVRQFEAFVWKPMGFDRHPELIEMMFGGYETLVHLAQVEDAGLDAKAREAAARLGLAHERRFTGYGDLAPFLAKAAGG
ncbi:MAG: DUF1638 domain-containing protein [Pseudomonadota bacterium]